MERRRNGSRFRRFAQALLLAGASVAATTAHAQFTDTPLISGGAGFFSSTEAGNTSYNLQLVPVLEAPIGKRVLIESRGSLFEGFSPETGKGYDSFHALNWSYAQADVLINSHITAVGGYFLTPFGTYNERLTPIWISNFQDAPLIFPLGNGNGNGAALGGMLRGNAFSNHKFSVSYAAYVSAGSTNAQFGAGRATGAQASVYMPQSGLELGVSYDRIREQKQSGNVIGAHLWWTPAKYPIRIRSEYAHGEHSQGYWIESAYRLSQFGGETSLLGRLEPVARLQQTFRNSSDSGDLLPPADTQRADFALDYHLPHDVRIDTSYARQFSPTGNFNVWETGIVYRFLFPAWKGKSK